jgi:hypothetical protein
VDLTTVGFTTENHGGKTKRAFKANDAFYFFCCTHALELKIIEKLAPIHEAQLMTYLKLTGLRVAS